MSGLNAELIWTVHRIRTTFEDDIGNPYMGVGTGFWLLTANNTPIFVTNRHNVDPSMKFPKQKLHLTLLEIELRKIVGNKATPEVCFFAVKHPETCQQASLGADCVLLVNPLPHVDPAIFPIIKILRVKDLVSEEQFATKFVQPMETAFFIGFPGSNGAHWWDEKWGLPIARQCITASDPSIPFSNSQIKSTDILLVSGMSFSGSSGSPVLLPPRGIQPGGDIVDHNWRQAVLIGLMSGHFWEESSTPSMFKHTGLSYLTRSSTILELVRAAGL